MPSARGAAPSNFPSSFVEFPQVFVKRRQAASSLVKGSLDRPSCNFKGLRTLGLTNAPSSEFLAALDGFRFERTILAGRKERIARVRRFGKTLSGSFGDRGLVTRGQDTHCIISRAGYGDRMARLSRITVPGLPHHVTQRGNRRQALFAEPGDYALYRDLLAERCRANGVACWAYCLVACWAYCLRTNAPHSP